MHRLGDQFDIAHRVDANDFLVVQIEALLMLCARLLLLCDLRLEQQRR